MSIIICDAITVAYDNKIAVENVSFQLNEGDYLCIIGENGTGKSTLIKTLLGLCKPKRGSVTLQGISRKQIGYLPQKDGVAAGFPATVFEIVLSGRQAEKLFYTKDDRREALRALELLDIQELAYKTPDELSGGQRQRVFLARALCAQNKLIMLDEPTAALDSQATEELYSVLRRLNREMNMTVIIVSHDLAGATRDANKILKLDRSLVYFGTSTDYQKTAKDGK